MKVRLEHGGDWAGYMLEHGTQPLDFSANVSPLGVPEGVREAIARAAAQADRYPDPLCRELRRELARLHRVPEKFVLCGNGAADLIFRLVLALRPARALVTAPTFSEYEQALQLAGCEVRRHTLSAQGDFAVEESILEELTPGLDLLFLCEPNNPTGKTTSPALLRRIAESCRARGIFLVVDECFNELLDDPAEHTLEDLLGQSDHLLLLKAFTKSHAMAGVRLGYALCGSPELLEKMRRAGQPWAVSGLAQAAGLAALKQTDYLQRLRELIREQRPVLIRGLTGLGCRVCPGQANYLLFYHQASGLLQRLEERGVLVRDCSNYYGLGPGWYRAAVRTPEENQAFLAAMKEALS